MYRNLLAELTRANKKRKDLAFYLKISESALHYKLTGKSEFTLSECLKTKKFLNLSTAIEHLFCDEDKIDG